MTFNAENLLLIGSVLIFISIIVTKRTYHFGIPSLLIFLIVGMLFGSDGLGLQFNNASQAQFIGMMALSVILFTGGMDTRIAEIKPVLWQGLVLSTMGVLLTTFITGLFIYLISGWSAISISMSLLTSMLLAATMSSTDSASVFNLLRSQKMMLKNNLRPMLELESGSNDPMAYMLTIVLIQIISAGEANAGNIVKEFALQFAIGGIAGYAMGKFMVWMLNKIKGFVIGVVLFTPILALILYFTSKFSSTWWLWGFVAVALFQTLMIVIYPMFIIPLFNKLEDLPEGELKTALFDLAKRGGFFAKTIQVIDGSRRSAHSNAYFTGFGKFRRIVLFDTLINQLQQSELEAVLAHEIGHYRKGHIVKMIVVSYAMTFVMFAFLGYLADCRWFYEQFGFSQGQGIGSVLLIFALFSGAFTFWFAPVSNYFSRKREYEADTFAAELCGGGQPLISALKKLHKKNLGNLTPHPLYSAFHYSHPTLLERMDNLYR